MKKLMLSGYKVILKNLACILLILALIPSVNYHLFNGFPFSGMVEYALLLSLLPYVFLRKYSRLHTMVLGRLWRKLPLIFILLAVLAAAGKVVLFQSGTYQGFVGCYTSPAAAPSTGDCERSYENPFFRFKATRLDQSLSFYVSNWNLGFVNSNRFNFYRWELGSIDRKRIPLSVEWSGTVEIEENEQIVVTYVGEGRLRIGEIDITLPATYQETNQVTLTVPQGIHFVEISYTFDDGYRIGAPDPGEYTVFRLRTITDSGEWSPLPALPPAIVWIVLGGLIDLITVALWASILYTYIVILRRKLFVFLIVSLIGGASLIVPEMPGLTRPRLLLVLIGALFVYLLLQRRVRHRLLIAYLCFACLGLFRVLMDSHALGTVLVQYGGTDQLTYASFAREILETGSLRAGEAIFYYQPAYRYLAFFLNLLLGESNVFVSALATTALNWGIFFLSECFFLYASSLRRRLIMLGIALTMLVLINNSQVLFDLVQYGTSEYPTWIILAFVLGFILSSKPSQYWPITTLLIGLGMIIRTEQIPALAVVYLIFLIRTYRAGRKVLLSSLGLLLGIFLLPALHNLYYGGAFAILPTSKGIPESLAISPIKALTTLASRDTQQIIIQQIKDMAGFGSRFNVSMGLALPLHILQALWLFAWLYALVRWRSIGCVPKLVLLLPFAYLGVYLFYYSHYDYPRHVLASYLAMGYGVLLVASGFGRRETAR